MRTTETRAAAPRDRRQGLRDRRDRIRRLHDEAIAAVLPAKAEQTTRQWLSRHKLGDAAAAHPEIAALALAMAVELESFTPSHTGATTVDRLMRQGQRDPEDRTAAESLKGARFIPFVIASPAGGGLFDAEDLATGLTFTLFHGHLQPEAVGVPLIARIGALDAETSAIVGLVLPLDPASLAVAMEFVRPGRGIPHGHRCAAAVYRHIARHGGLEIPGLNGRPAPDDGPEVAEPGPSAIDAAAAKLVRDGVLHDPTPDVLAEVRRLASAVPILEALTKAAANAGGREPKIVAIYRRFAEVMMEALHLRALAGSGHDRAPLDVLSAAIERQAALGGYPRAAAELFRDIRRGLAAAKPRQDREDLSRVIERIRGLRAKTVDQGCTEEEALAAADKVAELLDRYGLSLGETDLRRQACLGVGIESDRKRSGALDDCLPAVARFCDCRAWQERTADGTIRSILFGLPADVEAAQYLYERVATAFDTETAAFRKGELYGALAGEGRRKATTSFQLGLSRGIGAKLRARKAERDAKTFRLSGRDLVPVKDSIVDDELAKLGLSFTAASGSRGRTVLVDAFAAGQVAAGRFEIQSELG